MTTATDIIRELLPRRSAPVLEKQTRLSYGWGLWLRALPETLGRISREKAESVVVLLSARRPRPPEPVPPALSRWRALRSLTYQDWDPPPRDQRSMRWLAGFISALVHLLFALFLVTIAVVKLPPPPPAGDSSRVQVEFIGQGTPLQTGGGEAGAQAPVAAAATPAASAQAQSQPSVQTPTAGMEIPAPAAEAVSSVQEREIPEPAPAPPPQTLQVTETPVPTQDFVLPPPSINPQPAIIPELRPRELSVRTREVTVLERPPVPPPAPAPGVTLASPPLSRPVQEVRQREIAAPLPSVNMARVPTRPLLTRDLKTPETAVREMEISAPASTSAATVAQTAKQPGTSPATGTASSTATASSPSSATSSGAANAGAGKGAQPATRASGPATADRSGGWQSAQRGDDWGDSTRNKPGDSAANAGDKPGVFNADGSIRLGDGAANTPGNRGAPGGDNDQWTRERIDQAGTWLKRPPYDYEPTSLDKYWVPHESLLAEWVRKGIKTMSIPIPGTSKRISCVVSMLQLGGGCGIKDPNLNEQPPQARPPPEIPIKRTPIPTDS